MNLRRFSTIISGIYTRVSRAANKLKRDVKWISAESIREQIPDYLSQDTQEKLIKALEDFPESTDYYINRFPDEYLQGDGWNSFVVFDFASGDRKPIKGVLLNNSCDVSPENKRDFSTDFCFSPIVKLNKYQEKLQRSTSLTHQQIASKIDAIKRQSVSNIFYLPQGANLEDDYIALLGKVHTVPKSAFELQEDQQKLFTLSQVGFYLFTFKLSVHFCRLHEGIDRGTA